MPRAADLNESTQTNFWVIGVILLGIILRLALSAISYGTNDVTAWKGFATAISAHGLGASYREIKLLNHPPLVAMFSVAALKLSCAVHTRFEFIIRLPAILADGMSCFLLLRIWNRRDGSSNSRRGWTAAVAMAFSPIAILISAYHGNTDCIYASLTLLALLLMEEHRVFLAGLAIGAALNVKLIPIVVLLPMFAMCRDRNEFKRFLAACMLWTIPFVVGLLIGGFPFILHVVLYRPSPYQWGILYLLTLLRDWRPTYTLGKSLTWIYTHGPGNLVVLGGCAALAWAWWKSKLTDSYEVATACLAAMLTLAPGFGVQYLVAILPVMLAWNVSWGIAYSLVGGAFATLLYWTFLDRLWPPRSFFEAYFPPLPAAAGLLPWAMFAILCAMFLSKLRRTSQTPVAADIPGLLDDRATPD